MIGRLVRWTLGAMVLSSVVAAIAAIVAKGRLPSRGGPHDDEIALTAILEPLAFESAATSFRGGTLTCWFGGADLDLRGATLDPAGGHLTIRVLFGGGRLIVPEDWDVRLDVTGILGGVGDSRESTEAERRGPSLIVDGFAALGGFGIVSTKPELDA